MGIQELALKLLAPLTDAFLSSTGNYANSSDGAAATQSTSAPLSAALGALVSVAPPALSAEERLAFDAEVEESFQLQEHQVAAESTKSDKQHHVWHAFSPSGGRDSSKQFWCSKPRHSTTKTALTITLGSAVDLTSLFLELPFDPKTHCELIGIEYLPAQRRGMSPGDIAAAVASASALTQQQQQQQQQLGAATAMFAAAGRTPPAWVPVGVIPASSLTGGGGSSSGGGVVASGPAGRRVPLHARNAIGVRITLKGFGASNVERLHALARCVLYRSTRNKAGTLVGAHQVLRNGTAAPPVAALTANNGTSPHAFAQPAGSPTAAQCYYYASGSGFFTQPKDVLRSLQRLAGAANSDSANVSDNSPSNAVDDAHSLTTRLELLQSLALSTGALAPLLDVTSLLLSHGSVSLPPPAAVSVRRFLRKLALQWDAVAAACEGPPPGSWLGASTDPDRTREAKWSDVSSGCTVDEETGRSVKAKGSPEYAVLDLGIVRSGRLVWEVRLDKDVTSEECTCFGFTSKPITSASYDSSPEMYLYRAYNGQMYARGAQGHTRARFHVNDVVRFCLEMDKRECRAWVNGEEQGVIFENLPADQPLFPCVQFYSGNRAASLVKIAVFDGAFGPAVLVGGVGSNGVTGGNNSGGFGGANTTTTRTPLPPLPTSGSSSEVLTSAARTAAASTTIPPGMPGHCKYLSSACMTYDCVSVPIAGGTYSWAGEVAELGKDDGRTVDTGLLSLRGVPARFGCARRLASLKRTASVNKADDSRTTAPAAAAEDATAAHSATATATAAGTTAGGLGSSPASPGFGSASEPTSSAPVGAATAALLHPFDAAANTIYLASQHTFGADVMATGAAASSSSAIGGSGGDNISTFEASRHRSGSGAGGRQHARQSSVGSLRAAGETAASPAPTDGPFAKRLYFDCFEAVVGLADLPPVSMSTGAAGDHSQTPLSPFPSAAAAAATGLKSPSSPYLSGATPTPRAKAVVAAVTVTCTFSVRSLSTKQQQQQAQPQASDDEPPLWQWQAPTVTVPIRKSELTSLLSDYNPSASVPRSQDHAAAAVATAVVEALQPQHVLLPLTPPSNPPSGLVLESVVALSAQPGPWTMAWGGGGRSPAFGSAGGMHQVYHRYSSSSSSSSGVDVGISLGLGGITPLTGSPLATPSAAAAATAADVSGSGGAVALSPLSISAQSLTSASAGMRPGSAGAASAPTPGGGRATSAQLTSLLEALSVRLPPLLVPVWGDARLRVAPWIRQPEQFASALRRQGVELEDGSVERQLSGPNHEEDEEDAYTTQLQRHLASYPLLAVAALGCRPLTTSPLHMVQKVAAAPSSQRLSGANAACALLRLLRLFAWEALSSTPAVAPQPWLDDISPVALHLPWAVQADGHVLQALQRLLLKVGGSYHSHQQPQADELEPPDEIACSLLTMLRAHLARLVVAQVRLEQRGMALGHPPLPAGASAATASFTLSSLHDSISALLAAAEPSSSSSSASPSIASASVRAEASAVLDAGLPLFCPSVQSQRAYLQAITAHASSMVLSVSFQWPVSTLNTKPAATDAVSEEDASDGRFERAVLLLQSYASQQGWRHSTIGQWGGTLHFVAELPVTPSSATAAVDAENSRPMSCDLHAFITVTLRHLLQSAGIIGWSFPRGCADPPIAMKIARSLPVGSSSGNDVSAALQPSSTSVGCVGDVTLYAPSSPPQSHQSLLDFPAVTAHLRRQVEQEAADLGLEAPSAANPTRLPSDPSTTTTLEGISTGPVVDVFGDPIPGRGGGIINLGAMEYRAQSVLRAQAAAAVANAVSTLATPPAPGPGPQVAPAPSSTTSADATTEAAATAAEGTAATAGVTGASAPLASSPLPPPPPVPSPVPAVPAAAVAGPFAAFQQASVAMMAMLRGSDGTGGGGGQEGPDGLAALAATAAAAAAGYGPAPSSGSGLSAMSPTSINHSSSSVSSDQHSGSGSEYEEDEDEGEDEEYDEEEEEDYEEEYSGDEDGEEDGEEEEEGLSEDESDGDY